MTGGRWRGSGLAALVGLMATHAVAAPPPDTDAYVAKVMRQFGAPGLSLAIVEDGQVALAKGYGVRRLGDPAPVDAHTSFPIGSETKAFTAAALAILVDRGKLSWDDHVVDRLPGFAMYDPYATAHMTVRDLLTHRSGLGLGEGDLLVIPGTRRTRADLVHALRYLPPKTGFRERFAYDNILYIVAGALVEAVSGERWEDFVRENVFRPAGMADAHADYDGGDRDTVALHARTSTAIRGEGPETVLPLPEGFFSGVGPAGGISASAQDMGRWMQLQLAHGALLGGGRLWSEAQGAELWRPVVVVPPEEFKLPAPMAAMQPDLQTYALGWFVESYRGHMVVEHSGAVFGALAMLYLIPDRHVGIAVAINSEDSAARRAVTFHLLDHYLGLAPTDWPARLTLARAQSIAGAKAVLATTPDPQPGAGVSAALPLDGYVGTYRDPWYGPMTISQPTPGRLAIRFDLTPGMDGALEPLGGERFRTRWSDRNIEDAFVDFTAAGGSGAGRDDEGHLAAGGLQLRLPGPALRGGGGSAERVGDAREVGLGPAAAVGDLGEVHLHRARRRHVDQVRRQGAEVVAVVVARLHHHHPLALQLDAQASERFRREGLAPLRTQHHVDPVADDPGAGPQLRARRAEPRLVVARLDLLHGGKHIERLARRQTGLAADPQPELRALAGLGAGRHRHRVPQAAERRVRHAVLQQDPQEGRGCRRAPRRQGCRPCRPAPPARPARRPRPARRACPDSGAAARRVGRRPVAPAARPPPPPAPGRRRSPRASWSRSPRCRPRGSRGRS